MKLFIISFLLLSGLQSMAQVYGQRIYMPDNADAALKESVTDMAFWLQKATGTPFEITNGATPKIIGISLEYVGNADVSTKIKEQVLKDGQSFYLKIDGASSAQIIGTGTNSFINGIYTFLHELGFCWYMPGDNWTIVPKIIKPGIKIKKVYTPDFGGRFYAGTGGVNSIAGIDPKNNFKQDYDLWNRRNRFSTDYAITKHSGQAFYNANKKFLDAHPEWFCNGIINSFGRIDISKPEVVQLFVDWALNQVKPNDRFPTIIVDPSDGAGGKDDCLPKSMPEIKTWSDKYFWLANQVAGHLGKNDSKTQVQLYAYASYAAPPGFALENNVYPVIIPYAFQGIASPEKFIKLWSDKMNGRPIGMYDYWNITQWSSGIPQFNIYSIPEKLRLWKKNNVTSINIETTNGKGAMGPAFWLASQMMWNTNLSFDSLYNVFLNTCFGPAAPDVKRMYDRWSKNYQQEMEVNLSLQDLASASSKTNDAMILARLSELKAYVHYLKLFYDYQAAPKSGEAYEKLVNYIRSIHSLRLVQSSALLERYIKAPAGFKSTTTENKIDNISSKGIEEQFKKNIKENTITYPISDFTFDIRRVKALTEEPVVTAKYINGRNNYQFFLSKPRMFHIKAGSDNDTKLIITDASQKIWFEKVIPGMEGYRDIQVQLPSGIYNLSFGDFGRFSRLTFPSDLVFVSIGTSYYDNAGFPLHYVYVPKDAGAIIYEDKLGPGTNNRGFWLNPDGKRVDPVQLKNSIYQIEVPPQYRGKVWTLNIGHRSFKLLNIPNRFSIRKFEYNEN